MALKRYKKRSEGKVGDIRTMTLPVEVDRAPKLIFDPEKEVTDEDWAEIVRQMEYYFERFKAIFYETMCVIYFIFPQRFPELLEKFHLNFQQFKLHLGSSDYDFSKITYNLALKILFPGVTPEPKYAPRSFEQLAETINWIFEDNMNEYGVIVHGFKDIYHYGFSADKILHLLYLYPEKKEFIRGKLAPYKEQILKQYKRFKSFDTILTDVLLIKIFFPEEFDKLNYKFDRKKLDEYLVDVRKAQRAIWSGALDVFYYLKIIHLRKIDITPQGFVEGAPEAAEQIGADIPEQPKTLNI